ncbi:hypothetical protein [Paenacidovorax caeni]|uniref:hypothetical protein n=1 Tax=Paenacidovorax caeni TaxID=343013 RepID=UPI000ABABD05|nr:hypothetical protein [Paenacidovorax caeni]
MQRVDLVGIDAVLLDGLGQTPSPDGGTACNNSPQQKKVEKKASDVCAARAGSYVF